jgi:hypothetical protein
MVLRKVAAALLLLRIIESRHSLNTGTIAKALAHIRSSLSKYPLLAEFFEATAKIALAVLQRVRGPVQRAAAAAAIRLQEQPPHSITSTSRGELVWTILKKIACVVIQIIVKIDSAMKALAPFARFRIVFNVMRREQARLHLHSTKP